MLKRSPDMPHAAIATDQGPQLVESQLIVVTGRTRAVRSNARLCLACGERRALFYYRGEVKADRDHNLCFECYRAEVNRLRSRRLAAAGWWAPLPAPDPPASRTVADRAGLMRELQVRRRQAQITARHALAEPELPPAAETLAS
jgi:hypothetical protein